VTKFAIHTKLVVLSLVIIPLPSSLRPSLPPSFLPSLSLPFPSHFRSALHSMLSYIRQAREKLNSLSSTISQEAEAAWFMKIAWNLALQCGEHYHEMGQLFSMCHQVCDQFEHRNLSIVSPSCRVCRTLVYHLLPLHSCWVVLPLTHLHCRGRRHVS